MRPGTRVRANAVFCGMCCARKNHLALPVPEKRAAGNRPPYRLTGGRGAYGRPRGLDPPRKRGGCGGEACPRPERSAQNGRAKETPGRSVYPQIRGGGGGKLQTLFGERGSQKQTPTPLHFSTPLFSKKSFEPFFEERDIENSPPTGRGPTTGAFGGVTPEPNIGGGNPTLIPRSRARFPDPLIFPPASPPHAGGKFACKPPRKPACQAPRLFAGGRHNTWGYNPPRKHWSNDKLGPSNTASRLTFRVFGPYIG